MPFSRPKSFPKSRRSAFSQQAETLERRLFLSAAIAAFQDQQSYPVGHSPVSITVADVNRDGKPDLIIANSTDNSVGVLLGIGDGTFQAQQTFSTGYGSHPFSVAIADVNGDGKPDLIVANYGTGTVGVLLGNGNGTFRSQQTFVAPGGPIAIAAADVNGDGKVDLLTADYGSNSVGVLLGYGDGSFLPQQTFSAEPQPISIAAADINGDGKLDLAVTNYKTGTASVLLGNGSGAFQSPQSFSTGAEPRSIAIADVNDDGKLDLLVANKADSTASVLLGSGNGNFLPQQTFDTGLSPNAIAVSDVNVDGKPDLIIANENDDDAGVLLGNGDGTFQPEKSFATGTHPYAIAVADVNGDGRPDLIVANQSDNTIGVMLGDVPPTVLSINRTSPPGPITSDSSVTYTVTFNESVTGVDPTDFALTATGGVSATTPVVVTPENGSIYLVTINGITGTGTLGLNLTDDGSIQDAMGNPLQAGGNAAFQPRWTFSIPAGLSPEPKFTAIAATDVNGDGTPDIVLADNLNYDVQLLLGNSNGTFQPPVNLGYVADPVSVTVADVNGDGKPDIVVGDVAQTIYNAKSGDVIVFLGNGNGTFQPERTFDAGGFCQSAAVADVNGDGKLDLIAAETAYSSGARDVAVLLGNGNGTFQAPQTFSVSFSPTSIAIADVNGDGKPDVLTVNEGYYPAHAGTVSILLGNGNGTLQPQQTFAAGTYPTALAVADLNKDGRSDLVVADEGGHPNQMDGTVTILLGNGNGTFASQSPISADAGGYSNGLAVADVNGDGTPDLITVTEGVNLVDIMLGNGNGTFGARQTFIAGPDPTAVTVSDLNGDGRPGLLVANSVPDLYGRGTISVLLGNSDGSFTGQTYTIVPDSDAITGTSAVDQITLVQNPDHQHIDWTLNGSTAEMAIGDPNGLTINGNGSNDIITLQYSNGSPLPNTLHLKGTFIINGLQGSTPLLNTTLEIGRSTVYISYASPTSDPIAAIKQYLQNGYNNGSWNGIPSASPAFPGDITSIPAAQNAAQTTAIGYADSADGLIAGQPANTIELKYTLYGDTTLAGTVGFNDFTRMTQHWNQTSGGTWDTADFNYDGSVNSADFTLMTRTYNTSLGSQASPAVTAAASGSQQKASPPPTPPAAGVSVVVKPGPTAGHHVSAVKHHKKRW